MKMNKKEPWAKLEVTFYQLKPKYKSLNLKIWLTYLVFFRVKWVLHIQICLHTVQVLQIDLTPSTIVVE